MDWMRRLMRVTSLSCSNQHARHGPSASVKDDDGVEVGSIASSGITAPTHQ
jgi:hypothetical protein